MDFNELQICTSFMAMQCPILFPYGENGHRLGIKHSDPTGNGLSKREKLTMREYYAYPLQYRATEGHTLHLSGKLFQQYVVDAFMAVEEEQFRYIRNNQKKLCLTYTEA